MATMKPPTPGSAPEIPRRVVDIPGTMRRRPLDDGPSHATSSSQVDRKLIVGRGITLTGEIGSCDHLVVEGSIECRIKDCRNIEVADGGIFKGSAEIGEADIGGRFEGDLSVSGRLNVRGTGVISGSIRYGELSVEVGARLIGTLEPLEPKVRPLSDAMAHLREERAAREPIADQAD